MLITLGLLLCSSANLGTSARANAKASTPFGIVSGVCSRILKGSSPGSIMVSHKDLVYGISALACVPIKASNIVVIAIVRNVIVLGLGLAIVATTRLDRQRKVDFLKNEVVEGRREIGFIYRLDWGVFPDYSGAKFRAI
ncbi:unnamed protein product [Dovyalis caffra]|uniref:Uncharacterized protein n=1 Tax=Dovyalis caffra TaxID=77055 RepID=A0AAV1ST40_9ROSI|nr:unnamed protein product [Dovyalis caffra]